MSKPRHFYVVTVLIEGHLRTFHGTVEEEHPLADDLYYVITDRIYSELAEESCGRKPAAADVRAAARKVAAITFYHHERQFLPTGED